MKIKTLYVLALLTLTASLASAQGVTRCGGPTNALNINWPTFQFDDCRTGYNPYETRLNTGNVRSLALAWQSTTGNVSGYPVLANNVVYVGSQDNNLYAFNALTGTLIWSYATGGPIYGTPAVANGVLYIGSNDKNLYALNANTGALLWKYTAQGSIMGAPAVANGTVYVASDDGVQGYLYALNASTGALLWQYTTDRTLSTPTVVNGIIYFVTPGVIHALNARNASVIWQYYNGHSNDTPTVINGVLYSAGAYLYAIDALSGTPLWIRQDLPVYAVSCAVANGVVYLGGRNQSYLPSVYAFDAKNGTQLWQSHDDYKNTYDLVVANGVLYYASIDPNGGALVNAVDAKTGTFAGQLHGVGGLFVANGFLYMPWNLQSQGGVMAYHLPN